MMKNLFIMHTQYNLILACGIANERFKDCQNELVLYAEFKLSDALKKNLEKNFSKVYYITESFIPPANPFKDDLLLIKHLKKSSVFLKNKYDNVFLSQERPYDTYVVSKLKKHSDFKLCSVEEDVYYSVNNKLNTNPPKKIKKSALGKVRDILKRGLLGKNKYYQDIYFYGMNTNYDENNVLFPDSIRCEMQKEKLCEVKKAELEMGINLLYNDVTLDIPESEKYILFYFDLTDRYKNPHKIKEIVEYLLDMCINNKMCFMYKYHPRETEGFEFLKQSEAVFEIPATIPSEKVAASLLGKDVLVAGNLTTALWVSKKLGYDVVSAAGIENEENKAAAKALTSMGIKVLYKTDDIKNKEM